MARRFERTKEDFICGNCGHSARGNGYTNHCPACLWSRHVDMNPGDRMAACGGMMEPVSTELKNGAWIILHRCLSCGFKRKNKTVVNDNFDAVLEVAARSGGKFNA